MTMNTTQMTKGDHLAFIGAFASNTDTLNQPMVSFFGQGAYDVDDAIEFILNLNDASIPDAFVVCGANRENDYWNSAYIYKQEDGSFLIEPDNMMPISDRFADDIPNALFQATLMVDEINKVEADLADADRLKVIR